MKLWDIDAEIASVTELIDEETGELLPEAVERLKQLMKDREDTLEWIALTIKNLASDAAAIKSEIDNLSARMKSAQRRADKLKDFLQYALAGEKISTPRVAVSYRKSTAVELDPEFVRTSDLWWLRVPAPEPDKQKIKDALKAGETVPGAKLVERINMTIK